MTRQFERYPLWCVLLLMLLCLSPVMALRDFSPSNELRYLSIADEALREGHVFAFTNQGLIYADKPPLYFWIIMLCRLIFGRHCMYVLSLFSLIPAATIILTMDRWVFGGGSASPAKRAAAALTLGTTGLFLGMSVFLRMDMLMVMFIVLALYSWHRDWPWMFALWTFMALFTKGPVGILMPPLAVLCYIISARLSARRAGRTLPKDPQLSLGRWLGWRFWLLMAALCGVWFTGVWLDGGREYLDNLLVHQTVGRAVNSFHHDKPFWYYLANIWAVTAPWCLLAIPVLAASLCRRGVSACPETASPGAVQTARSEKMLRCATISTFVMLSCFSAKLSIYLAPVFPFVIYLVPLYVDRCGWKRWMAWSVAVPAALLGIVGLALVALPFAWSRIPALEPYGFVRSPLVGVAGAVLLAGGLAGVREAFVAKSPQCTMAPAVALLLTVLLLSPLVPRANDWIGYGGLCSEIPEGQTVYTRRVHRPENMDVYLGRDIVKLDKEDAIPADGVFVSKASLDDPALEGRVKKVHGEYAVWLPVQ